MMAYESMGSFPKHTCHFLCLNLDILQNQEECIHAGEKQNHGDHLQAEGEIPLLHPAAEIVQQVWSWTGTRPSAPQEHSLSTRSASLISASRVFVTSPWVLKGPGEVNLTRKNLLLPGRSVYSPPSALRVVACTGLAFSQTDSAVRSHSLQSSLFLTPPLLPLCTQRDVGSRASALIGDWCIAVIASIHLWIVKLRLIKTF